MDTSSFFLTAVGGAGIGYLFGRVQTWLLARKLERHNIKPSEWEQPITAVISDAVDIIGKGLTS